MFGIPQLVNPSEVARRSPAALVPLRPRREGFPRRLDGPPWDPSPESSPAASRKSAACENAGRLVSSAKSWLSHSGVDRTLAAAALARSGRRARISRPWKLVAAIWTTCAMPGMPRCPTRLSPQQQVLVTVPASFDAVARDLTLEGRRTGRLSRTSRCSKSRKPPSTPGSNAIPTGASASTSAT